MRGAGSAGPPENHGESGLSSISPCGRAIEPLLPGGLERRPCGGPRRVGPPHHPPGPALCSALPNLHSFLLFSLLGGGNVICMAVPSFAARIASYSHTTVGERVLFYFLFCPRGSLQGLLFSHASLGLAPLCFFQKWGKNIYLPFVFSACAIIASLPQLLEMLSSPIL